MLLSISGIEYIAEFATSSGCWRSYGAVFRTAPFLMKNVARFSDLLQRLTVSAVAQVVQQPVQQVARDAAALFEDGQVQEPRERCSAFSAWPAAVRR